MAVLLTPGRAVATHSELRAAGFSPATICRRIGPDGPWQRLLPGVVAGHRGIPTRHERSLAALKYAGDGAVLTGIAALIEHGVLTARRHRTLRTHVLVPHACQRTSHGFAHITRTRYPPASEWRNRLPCAQVARAVIDACRWITDLNAVRELVAEVVQRRLCTIEQLAAQVKIAARQRTALARAVLREMDAGIRSAAEAELRILFRRHGVPEPLWNADLFTPSGDFIASPDALWEDVMAALELDSMAWHLSPAAYRRTQKRQRLLVRHNVSVLPIAPADALADGDATCHEVIEFLTNLAGRPLPDVIVRPRARAA